MKDQDQSHILTFTGERFLPEQFGNIAAEHIHRYRTALQIVDGLDVLDLACGEGYGTSMLGQRARRVFGVDIAVEAIKHASSRYMSDNISFLRGRADNIPIGDASVDIVVSFETIEHVKEQQRMLTEIKRVLRPGGALLLSSPNKQNYTDETGVSNKFHIKELYKEEFLSLVAENFSNISSFGQRLVFGSAIISDEMTNKLNFIEQNGRVVEAGLPRAVFSIALASDSRLFFDRFCSSFMEYDIYKSDPISEKFSQIEQLRTELQESEDLRIQLEQQLLLSRQAEDVYKQSASETRAECVSIANRLGQAVARENCLQSQIENITNDLAISRGSVSIYKQLVSETQEQFAANCKQLGEALAQENLLRSEMQEVRDEVLDGRQKLDTIRTCYDNDRASFSHFVKSYSNYIQNYNNRIVTAIEDLELKIFQYSEKSDVSIDPSAMIENRLDYRVRLREIIHSGYLTRVQNVCVVTTTHTSFVGLAICDALKTTRLKCSHCVNMPNDFDHDLYIVVCPQMFVKLPPNDKTIHFQMEQTRSSPWFTSEYIKLITSSLCVFDYSVENISYLLENGLELYQTYFVPVEPYILSSEGSSERDIDVLFYGAINSTRRRTYIEALSEQFNVRVESELFGGELINLLRRTKVVVNIHFYEDALLETTRISEALSYGAHVISETARDQADQSRFEGIVRFIAAGDLPAFLIAVRALLDSYSGPVLSNDLEAQFGNSYWNMRSLLLRALHGVGVLDYAEFEGGMDLIEMPSDKVVLCLPESLDRYRHATSSPVPVMPFPGLRNVDGWKGCALSYKFLASKALQYLPTLLTIWEDDAEFEPDFRDRLDVILTYLEKEAGEWDIFSGLLTDLSPTAAICDSEIFESEHFIKLDSVIGMVFGIYNRSALQIMSGFEIMGEDTAKHTIDRVLESYSPTTISVFPPVVGHADRLHSTLWLKSHGERIGNQTMVRMILGSQKRVADAFTTYMTTKQIDQQLGEGHGRAVIKRLKKDVVSSALYRFEQEASQSKVHQIASEAGRLRVELAAAAKMIGALRLQIKERALEYDDRMGTATSAISRMRDRLNEDSQLIESNVRIYDQVLSITMPEPYCRQERKQSWLRLAIQSAFRSTRLVIDRDPRFDSNDISPHKNFIAELYQFILHRKVDEEGLIFWSSMLSAGREPGQITREFLSSPEYITKWQSGDRVRTGSEVKDFLSILYRYFLDREIEGEGLRHYSLYLATGGSISKLVDACAHSEERRRKFRRMPV